MILNHKRMTQVADFNGRCATELPVAAQLSDRLPSEHARTMDEGDNSTALITGGRLHATM
jgi:hypothetical protein